MFLSLKTLYRKRTVIWPFTLHNYTDFIEKIINILLIAILSIIFIGLALFVVNFAKESFNHNENKEDQNITHQSTKKIKRK